MTAPFELVLEALSARVGADVAINGFSVFSNASTRPKALAARIDGFVVQGANRVRATVHPLPLDPTAKEPPTFEVQLDATPSGEPRDVMDRILLAAYSPDAQRFPPSGVITVLDHTFDMPSVAVRYRFLDGRPQDDDRPAREHSATLVRALEARGLDRVRELFATRFSELAAASGTSRTDFEDGFLDPIGAAMKGADYRVEAVPPAQLEVEAGFGGRVLHVKGPGGKPAAVVRGAGVEVCLSWSIAEIDSALTIVR